MRTQFLLPGLSDTPAPSFDNFIIGRNAQAVAAVSTLGQASDHTCLYLWGEPGCGRRHLARAWLPYVTDAREDPSLARLSNESYEPQQLDPLLALTHVEALNEVGQIVLFNRYNAAREGMGALLVTGDAPPAQLPLREDVKTRLGWSLVFQLHSLSDDERRAALQGHAKARGMVLGDEVLTYLFVHTRRDMPSLIRLLDALDLASLQAKRALTLPFVRAVLDEVRNPELTGL